MGFDITKKQDRDAYSNILKLAASQKGSPVKEINDMQDLLKEYGEAKGIFNVFKRRKIKKKFEDIKNKFDNASYVAAYMDTSKTVDNNKSEIYSSAGLVKAPEQSQYGAAQFARTHEYASSSSVSSRSSDSGVYASFSQAQEFGESQKANRQKLPEVLANEIGNAGTIFQPITPVAPPTQGINYGGLPPSPRKEQIYQTLPPEEADKSNYQPFSKTVQGPQTQRLAEQAAKKAQEIKGRS